MTKKEIEDLAAEMREASLAPEQFFKWMDRELPNMAEPLRLFIEQGCATLKSPEADVASAIFSTFLEVRHPAEGAVQ